MNNIFDVDEDEDDIKNHSNTSLNNISGDIFSSAPLPLTIDSDHSDIDESQIKQVYSKSKKPSTPKTSTKPKPLLNKQGPKRKPEDDIVDLENETMDEISSNKKKTTTTTTSTGAKKRSKKETNELYLEIDDQLGKSVGTDDLIRILNENYHCNVDMGNQLQFIIPYSIHFTKKVDSAESQRGEHCNFIIIKQPVETFYSMICQEKETRRYLDNLKRFRKENPELKFTIIIEGLDSFLRQQSKQINTSIRNAVFDKPKSSADSQITKTVLTRDRIEEILIPFQLELSCTIRFFNSREEIARYISQLYNSICKHLNPTGVESLFNNFCAESVKHKSRLNSQIWVQQLSQINGISPQIARGISVYYPTVKSLVDAYLDKPLKDRAHALKTISIDTNSGPRNLGPSLSTKIYNVFFSSDPNKVLNEKS